MSDARSKHNLNYSSLQLDFKSVEVHTHFAGSKSEQSFNYEPVMFDLPRPRPAPVPEEDVSVMTRDNAVASADVRETSPIVLKVSAALAVACVVGTIIVNAMISAH
jgi:hypothetical protein